MICHTSAKHAKRTYFEHIFTQHKNDIKKKLENI